ncbi:MAG: lecithin retinol acyltransferase family protein [Acholeplasmatales bacterium]|nr:lecithin retinol acyltransferase family protein [Acholeplasmatales bacterium]
MWIKKKPNYGDQIRVNRGLYFHHGIYVSDDEVIQYASPSGSEISPATALIISTTLDYFLNGGVVEVREYNDEELKMVRSKEEIVKFARSMLGTGLGEYSIVNNNCEHFSNYCAFGKKESNQVEDFLKMLFG